MTDPDLSILNIVIPRLIEIPGKDSMLGLEITDGPHKGIVFSFHRFHVLQDSLDDEGMVKTQFETLVHNAPEGFEVTEDFDHFCSDVLVAWLHYLSTHKDELNLLLHGETKGVH